ncbi:hypothetical protein JXB28_06515 [Candidatus Woesearchaeota archaeon]|nr:hypothetical protein [Candidatus Woesearchaeota archaeon]
MAFVFGVEGVPIFEMLFVISLLLLIGLIFVLLELRKLTSLISKEKGELERFEKDLSELEADTGKKSTSEIMGYIQDSIAKGITPDQIEASLVKRGWPKKEVDSILSSLTKK